jgi:hypothetical protein
MEPMSLSTSQLFEIEKMSRTIDSLNDIETLRKITKQLLNAWMLQKSATNWALREGLSRRPSIEKKQP